MNISKNSTVTIDLNNNNASNTFVVDTIEGETVLLSHPLAHGVLIRVPATSVNTTLANIKDSAERGIDFANSNKQYLDHNTNMDLEAVAIFFALKRKLTPRQKNTVANICGVVASVKFNDDLKEAMSFITKNASMLDQFNAMWYNNFKGLFSGQQLVTSNKQRSAIFNIAGYLLAELENPTANRRR